MPNLAERRQMKSISQCFGENVRRLRTEQGFTQEEFSKKAGLSISFLQNIEYGKKWAAPKTIKILANALKVSESDLFKDCSKKSAEPHPKDVLLMIGRAFGVIIPEELAAGLKVKNPPYAYASLHEQMPHEITTQLMNLCQSKDWDWEKFRARMAG
jgi:transcriptional regulator with XRE-family HTH domain